MGATQEREKVATAAVILRHAAIRKRTTKTLVNAERRTLALMRGAISVASNEAVARAAVGPQTSDHAHHAIRDAGAALLLLLTNAILDGRTKARRKSRWAIGEELRRLGLNVRSTVPPLAPIDEASAHASAASYSAAWSQRAIVESERIDHGPYRTIAPRIADAEDATLFRARRIATTETASAWNDEREIIYRQLSLDPPPIHLVVMWSAELDRKTCARCAGLDGTIIELGASWPDGTPPLHPNCRCTTDIVPA